MSIKSVVKVMNFHSLLRVDKSRNQAKKYAAFENVLAVGSKDREGHKISPIGNIEKSIVYLPGTNIVTIAPNNSYSTMFGTSPATAILTGIIAVVLEANPKIENKTIYKYFNKETLENVDVLRILKELGG